MKDCKKANIRPLYTRYELRITYDAKKLDFGLTCNENW